MSPVPAPPGWTGVRAGYQFVTLLAACSEKSGGRGGVDAVAWSLAREAARRGAHLSRRLACLRSPPWRAASRAVRHCRSNGRATWPARLVRPDPRVRIDRRPAAGVSTTRRQSQRGGASARQIAVVSRPEPRPIACAAMCRRRSSRDKTTFAWVWDVYDADKLRTLRITGEEPAVAPAAAATPGPPPTSRCCAGSRATAWTGSRPS